MFIKVILPKEAKDTKECYINTKDIHEIFQKKDKSCYANIGPSSYKISLEDYVKILKGSK